MCEDATKAFTKLEDSHQIHFTFRQYTKTIENKGDEINGYRDF